MSDDFAESATVEDEEGELIELPHKRYVPPNTYATGPIPSVPDALLACMPPHGMVHEYVWWATQCTYANPVWHIASILPALVYEFVQMGFTFPGRKRQAALQSFLLGRSTSAKSTCMRMAKCWHEDHLGMARPKGWDVRANSPWLEAEGTVAGLLEALHDRFDTEADITPAILYHEEVDGLISLRDPTVMRTLMQLFDARPAVERQLAKYRQMAKDGKTPPSIVERPAVGAVFCSTIASMTASMTSRHFEGGLVSRCLWFVAEPSLAKYADIVDVERLRQRCSVLERWTHYGPHLYGLRARGDESKVAHLSPEVNHLLHERITKRFQRAWDDDNDALAAQLQRCRMQAEVISTVYALSCGRLAVTVDDMNAACNLLELSLASVERLSGLTDDSDHWRLRKRALEVIYAQQTGADRTKLYRRLKVAKGELDALLATLIDEGVIVETRVHTKGRPRFVYKKPEDVRADAKVIELHSPANDDPTD